MAQGPWPEKCRPPAAPIVSDGVLDSGFQAETEYVGSIRVKGMRLSLRSHLRLAGTICLIAVSAYVLFDLMDIDGSDFGSAGEVCLLGAESSAGEKEGKCTWKAIPGARRAPPRLLPAGLQLSSAGLPLVSDCRNSSCLAVRPRHDTSQETTVPEEGSDPPKRSA
jgi:hypothetical protein